MFNHAPPAYRCPFCDIAAGIEQGVYTTQDNIVYRDGKVIAFIAAHFWPKNPGHVLVVPIQHFENLYDVPDEIGAAVFAASRRIAIALKRAYQCDGVSTRQHNEPAGHQDVWHYHLHIFPRYTGDQLYLTPVDQLRLTTPDERRPYAQKLREALCDIAV